MGLHSTLGVGLIALSLARLALATVTVYEDQAAWNTAVNNNFTTINFTGLPDWTYVTNQYADLGVTFGLDGADLIRNQSEIFPNDGSGLYGAISSITMVFSAPTFYLAHWYYAASKLELYYHDMLIYTGPTLFPPGYHKFVGYVSTQPFDKARVSSPLGGEINVDDLYFQPIPGPGALALLGAGLLLAPRRKRT